LDSITVSDCRDCFKNEIKSGLLICTKCNNWYPIRQGVPALLPNSLRDFKEFYDDFEKEMKSLGIEKSNVTGQDVLAKKKTQESFGFEWEMDNKFGWEENEEGVDIHKFDDALTKEHTKEFSFKTLIRKTLLKPEEIKDKVVLEGGCGNGRYIESASTHGARQVIGVDFSKAVFIAQENTKLTRNVHVVQGDLFNLPFQDKFEITYTIGVLHHTPDARKAALALADTVAEEGILCIHVYHRRFPLYHLVMALIKSITTKLPYPLLWKLSAIPAAYCRWAMKVSRLLYALSSWLMWLHPIRGVTFDHFSCPVATYHTEEELQEWFKTGNVKEVKGNNPMKVSGSYYTHIYPKWALRKDGTLKPLVHKLYPRWTVTLKGLKEKTYE
jgi:SAM-dependent methyltransferase